MKYVNRVLMPLEDHYYHHYGHALDVMERAYYIGKKESIADDDLEALCIAALFHDTGFVIQYDNNEPVGAKIATNYLKTILYPEDKIHLIESLILATDPAYKTPANKLEEIIKDADLDNLGREDFFDKAEKLKKEIEVIKKIKIKFPDWHHAGLDLLYDHHFFTQTQKSEREERKALNKTRLEWLIQKEEKGKKYNLDF